MDRNLRIRMLLEAGDRVTRPLRDIAGGSRAASAALKGTRDRLRELERTQGDIASFRKLKTDIRETETQMEGAQSRVAALARQMRETANPSRQLSRDFDRAKRSAADLKTQHEGQGRALQQLRDRLRQAGVGTGELAAGERALRGDIARTNRELTEQTERLTRADARARRFAAARDRFGRAQGAAAGMAASGASGIATGIALGRPIMGAVEEAREYESVMTDIAQKANLSRVQAAGLGRELLVAARAANQMPADMQAGVDALAGMGAAVPDAVRMMRPIGRAATAYKAEIADLAAATWAGVDNLKVPIGETARMLDIMAQAGKDGAFEIKDMASAFPALTAGYQALGQDGVDAVADLAAALQIARKGAGDSATAATNVANVIQKIASPQTIKNFAKFGVDLPAALRRAYAEGKTPLEAIAELTNRALGGDLSKIGFLFEDAQVQQGLRPLIQNMEEYRRIRAAAGAAGGVTDGDFAERMQDSAEKTKAAAVQSATLSIVLGGHLKPTIDGITEAANSFSQRLAGWAERHPRLTRLILLATAALAALFIVLGGAAIVIAAIMGPIAILNAGLIAMGVAGGVASIGLGPILLIVLAIVAVIALFAAAAYLLITYWDPITAWFGDLWTGLVAIVSGVLDWFMALPGRFFNFGRDMILGMIRGFTSMLGALRDAVTGAATSAANWFKQKLGIRSPSRVFAGFGGFMMQGLAQGIDRGAGQPVRRVQAVTAAVAAAMAAGSAAPIAASIGPGGAGGGGPGAAAVGAGFGPVTINVYAAPGQSARDIGEEVARQLDRHRRRAAADARSTFRDDPDGADL